MRKGPGCDMGVRGQCLVHGNPVHFGIYMGHTLCACGAALAKQCNSAIVSTGSISITRVCRCTVIIDLDRQVPITKTAREMNLLPSVIQSLTLTGVGKIIDQD